MATDGNALLARVRDAAGLARPLRVEVRRDMESAWTMGARVFARYDGRDPSAHIVHVAPGQRGVGLLTRIAHEATHAAQRERAGSWDAFIRDYKNQVLTFGYERAPLEVEARENAAAITAALVEGGSWSIQ